MAVTVLAVQPILRSGLTPVFTAANVDGHYVSNDGKTFFEVKNTNAAPITVTIATPQTVDGLAVTDRTVTVAATTGDKMIGPFTMDYNQTDSSNLLVTFSAVTDVTCAAFRV